MNGIYGFRPSYRRIPYQRLYSTVDGQDSIPPVLGPLLTDLGGIKLFTQTVTSQRPWLKDPHSLRKRWDEDEYHLKEHVAVRSSYLAFSGMTASLSLNPKYLRPSHEQGGTTGRGPRQWFIRFLRRYCFLSSSSTVIGWNSYK